MYVCIIGSAEALPILCVRYFRWEREIQTERERERQRRKWRHHCRAKIGDEFTLSLAKIRTFARDGSDVLIVALKIKIGDEFIIAPFVSILPKFRAFRDEWSNIRVIEHSPLSVQFCNVLARTMHHRIYGVCKFWHAPCTMVRCLYQLIMNAKLTLARLHKNALRFLPCQLTESLFQACNFHCVG